MYPKDKKELGQHLASNPCPHHFDLLDLREEGLGKLPAIFGLLPRFQGKI